MFRLKLTAILVLTGFAVVLYLVPQQFSTASGRVAVAAIDAPTSVDASDAVYSVKVQIHWDTMRGANLYRVYRNTTNNTSTAQDVGTTAANYYFDTPPNASVNYYYWVRAENGSTVSPLSATDQGSRAVGSSTPGEFGPLEPPVEPAENPVTASKAYLGKALFWEEQLSSTKTVSCGTCHRPANGGSDPRTVIGDDLSRNAGPDNTFNTNDDIFGSPGVPQNNLDGTYSWNTLFKFNDQVTGRKSPSYLNAGYTRNGLFWDGRAADMFRDQITDQILITGFGGLESQSAGPPVSAAEMGHTSRNWTQVASRIAASKPLALSANIPTGLKNWIGGRTYPQLFDEVFGSPDVTPARIAMAIATHERTLFTDRTPLDLAEQQITPLFPEEESGRNVFISLQCAVCHAGPRLSDDNYHNIGVRPQADDLGRGAITGQAADNARFKTPGLRNVFLRVPLMHNGRKDSVEAAVELYNRGGDFNAPNIERDLIRPLNLTNNQRADLNAFLKRPLTDPRVASELPPFDRPQLFTESNRVPVISGSGRAGTGSLVPVAKAIEPPLVGNPSFTVGVSGALGAAQAVVVIDSNDPGIGSAIPASGSFARVAVNLLGTGSGNGYGSVSLAIPNNPALVGQTFYGRWYVTDPAAANGFAVSRLFSFKVFSDSTIRRTMFDYDGDGKTDASVYRPANNAWYLLRSQAGFAAYQFGANGDSLVPADYTGDGKTDVAIWRPSTGVWFILKSEDNTVTGGGFGQNGDLVAPGDYDGDGKADLAVYRPGASSRFFVQRSTAGFQAFSFGIAEDKPTLGDFDGDGKTDFAVYRPSQGAWYRFNSGNGAFYAAQFGTTGDKIVPADYTGDGKTDIAIWRESTGVWFVLRSDDGAVTGGGFGSPGDIPAPGDYDGDGKTDFAVYRQGASSTFYVLGTTSGFQAIPWGINGDKPTPNAFVY